VASATSNRFDIGEVADKAAKGVDNAAYNDDNGDDD
jgi:hypothetical protein